MGVKACLNGSFPRGPGLARLYSRFHSGKLGVEGFEEGIRRYLRRLFTLLRDSGIKVFTDGMLRWDDILNPLISFVDGVEVNGLVRFYDNNFFVRAPKVRSELSIKDLRIVEWFKTSLRIADEVFGSGYVLKQPLPGPLTLAEFSINEWYGSYWSLLRDWRVKVLEPLIKELSRSGLRVVEIHEPALTWPGTRKQRVIAGTSELQELISHCKSLGIDVWVMTYFGYLGRVGKYLSRLGEAVVGIDPYAGNARKAPHRLVRDYGLSRVSLGAIDSRNTRIEGVREVRGMAKAVLRAGADEVYVGNNAPMDFIPEEVATRKIKRLGKVISKLFGGGE